MQHAPFSRLACLAALGALLPGTGVAQRPDSLPILDPISVRVTRLPEQLTRLGSAVTVVDSAALRRGRLGAGLDEALAFVPGVIATNRWNASLDQRLIIRGFGARANFGVRGIKIMLDGVPQTMPDGQSQLTNIDLSQIGRVEVLRGAASSAYGNAAGGVLAFTSIEAPRSGEGRIDAGMEIGTFGTRRSQFAYPLRFGTFSLLSSAALTTSNGFRNHSGSEQNRAQWALAWQPKPSTRLTLRALWGDDPRADNPGSLTLAEAAATPSAGAPNNIRRNAGKSLNQKQLALGLDHTAGAWSTEVRSWLLTRSIDNPLAAPAPSPTTADEGLWVGLDRLGGGVRASATRRLAGGAQLMSGIDLQSSRDDRENRRHLLGTPFGPSLLNQRESVREMGWFAQGVVPYRAWQLHGGVRWDQVRFTVDDAIGTGDGNRAMGALSGHGSIARQLGSRTLWLGVATAFETPTTTELANQPDGTTGLNRVLQPQQSVTMELGIRGAIGTSHGELVGWTTTTRDAITPFQEVGGRSYFTNAGRTRTRGVEAALTVPITSGLQALGTLTVTNATFRDYRLNGVQLAGRQVAGIPRAVGRVGIRGALGPLHIDLDHGMSARQYADDANTLAVNGWGVGVTGVRLQYRTHHSRVIAPFLAIQNVFDRRVIGSVTVNGSLGRVAEPSAGRTISVGGSFRLQGDPPQ